jgi:hypothetical protein
MSLFAIQHRASAIQAMAGAMPKSIERSTYALCERLGRVDAGALAKISLTDRGTPNSTPLAV